MLNEKYKYYLNRLITFCIDFILDLKNFGIRIALLNYLSKFSNIYLIKDYNISVFIRKKQHDLVYDYLVSKYANIIREYDNKEIEIGKNNSKIWCMWWNGLENSPQIIKNCVNHIEKYSGNYEVVIINKNNFQEYIDIPTEILNKLENGKITITHLSDIIRVTLLSKYGGIWIDSTVFVCDYIFDKFDEKIFNTAVIPSDKCDAFTNGRWCGFFMGGKSNKLFSFAYDFISQYYLDHDQLIDYVLLDYTIEIAYNNFSECKEYIDNADLRNPEISYFGKNLLKSFSEQEFKEVCSKYKFFKLSYKIHPDQFYNENGHLTNIGYFFSNQL